MSRLNGWMWAPSGLVLNLATLGPLGYLGRAPGTLGSLAGVVLFVIFFYGMPWLTYLFIAGLLAWVATGVCGEAEKRLHKRDPGEIVLDECVAMPLVFLGVPVHQVWDSWLVVLVGFVLFRIFDIVKPLGIARLQRLPGGSGIVMDDIAAALASCLCLHLWIAWAF